MRSVDRRKEDRIQVSGIDILLSIEPQGGEPWRSRYDGARAHKLGQRPYLPAEHPRGDFGDGIDTAVWQNPITTDLLEAGTTKELDSTCYAIKRHVLRFISIPYPAMDHATHYAEVGIYLEFVQDTRKVIGLERYIGV